MKFIVDKILGYLVKKETIDSNDEDELAVYRYGIEITLSSITNILVILLISLISNSIIEGLIFLAVFIPTRQYTGGYHADTYFKCNLAFGVSYIAVLLFYRFVSPYITLVTAILLLITEILFVLNFCPIENPNKPIDDENDKKHYRLKSTVIVTAFGIIGLVLSFNNILLGNIVLISLHLIVVLGIFGIIKERRKCYDEQGGKSSC